MKEKIPEPSKRFILGHFIWVDTSKIIPKNLGTILGELLKKILKRMIICSDPSTFTGNPLIEASERLA